MSETKQAIHGRRAACPGALLLTFLALSSAAAPEAWARGGFSGGGFRVAPSLRSSSLRIAPRLSAPRIQAPRPSPGSAGSTYTWGRTAAGAASPRLAGPTAVGAGGIAAQRSVYDSARRNGTLFSSKTEAAQSFRSAQGGNYGSRFASEPSSRPAWIPGSTLAAGRSVSVLYNPALGGYGYVDPLLGRWVIYDALADAAMLELLMGRHGYWWGAPPLYVSHGGGFVGLSIALFLLFALVSAIAARTGASRFPRGPRDSDGR